MKHNPASPGRIFYYVICVVGSLGLIAVAVWGIWWVVTEPSRQQETDQNTKALLHQTDSIAHPTNDEDYKSWLREQERQKRMRDQRQPATPK